MRIPKLEVGQFVHLWVVDHSSGQDTILVITAGVVLKVDRKTVVIDHWYSEDNPSEWTSAIDLRTVERVRVYRNLRLSP